MLSAKSQKFNLEPGFVIGTSYYIGDVNHSKHFYSPNLALGLSLKHNFNKHYALKLNLIRATLSGNDADFTSRYQQIRNHSFVNNIYELGLQTEFNFLGLNPYKKKTYSPYLTAGIALVGTNNLSSYTVAFPIGVGWKYVPKKKLTLSFEWAFRFTTTDNLDLLIPQVENTKQITKSNTNDMYSVFGVSLSYNFRSEKQWCPAYKKK